MPAAARPIIHPRKRQETLKNISRLISEFERAVGDDPAMRVAVLNLAVAGGAADLAEAATRLAKGQGSGQNRPWRWLAAVAREADRHQKVTLISHIALFTWFCTTQLDPHLTIGDRMDMRLDPAPQTVLPRFTASLCELNIQFEFPAKRHSRAKASSLDIGIPAGNGCMFETGQR